MLTSDELNAAIVALETGEEKPIPYLGFFWRHVDFDAESYDFGVAPIGGKLWVAFMENNKWGYPTVEAKGDAWAAIKLAIRVAVTEPSHQNLGVVKDLLQALVPPGSQVVPGKSFRGMTVEWDLVTP